MKSLLMILVLLGSTSTYAAEVCSVEASMKQYPTLTFNVECTDQSDSSVLSIQAGSGKGAIRDFIKSYLDRGYVMHGNDFDKAFFLKY